MLQNNYTTTIHNRGKYAKRYGIIVVEEISIKLEPTEWSHNNEECPEPEHLPRE